MGPEQKLRFTAVHRHVLPVASECTEKAERDCENLAAQGQATTEQPVSTSGLSGWSLKKRAPCKSALQQTAVPGPA